MGKTKKSNKKLIIIIVSALFTAIATCICLFIVVFSSNDDSVIETEAVSQAVETKVIEATETKLIIQTNTPEPSKTPEPTNTITPFVEQVSATLSDEYDCIPQHQISEGIVTNIVDGDTIDVSINGQVYRVRYIGMDTPEMSEENGQIAKDVNAQLVQGKTVTLYKDVSETDVYDRLLRYVVVDEIFVNYELVITGYANPASYPPDVACNELFRTAQQTAYQNSAGLWLQTPTEAPAASAESKTIIITNIFYDGVEGEKEPDEYVEIQNNGSSPVDITGWKLSDEANHTYTFPSFVMDPGKICRIYTNQVHQEWCGFSFGQTGSAIWNNGGDTAFLYDKSNEIITQKNY